MKELKKILSNLNLLSLFVCSFFVQTIVHASSPVQPPPNPPPTVWQKIGDKTADAAVYGVALAVGYIVYDLAKEGWRICKGEASADEMSAREREDHQEIELRKLRVKEMDTIIEKNNMIRQMCKDKVVDEDECKKMLAQIKKLNNEDSDIRSLSYQREQQRSKQALQSMAGKAA